MNKEFLKGFGFAVGALARDHGMPSVALDIMRCNGVTLAELKKAGVEQFDLKALAMEAANDRGNKLRRKRRDEPTYREAIKTKRRGR